MRRTAWSARGFLDQRSEWEAEADPVRSVTQFRQYDAFGRPGRVLLPDGQAITIDYRGDGSRTVTVPVAPALDTGGAPVLSGAATTETYDRFGRLAHLDDPNGRA